MQPGTVKLTLLEGAGEVVAAPEFFLNGNQRRNVSVRLKLNGPPAGNATLRLESTRGGVDERTIALG